MRPKLWKRDLGAQLMHELQRPPSAVRVLYMTYSDQNALRNKTLPSIILLSLPLVFYKIRWFS